MALKTFSILENDSDRINEGSDSVAALVNIRAGQAVNRNTNARLSDDAGGNTLFGGGTIPNTGDITLNNQSFMPTSGTTTFINRLITINGNSRIVSNGGHLNFVNCRIVIAGDRSTPSNIRLGAHTTFNNGSSGFADAAVGSSRSANFYGCSIYITATANSDGFFIPATDFINSKCLIATTDGRLSFMPQYGGGSRFISYNLRAGLLSGNDHRFRLYEALQIDEGAELDGVGYEVNDHNLGTTIFNAPRFRDTFKPQRMRLQSGNSNAPDLFLANVGFTAPNNTLTFNDLFGRANAYVTVRGIGAVASTADITTSGGAINFYAWEPTFLKSSDSTGIPNVRVKAASGVTLKANNIILNSASQSDVDNAITNDASNGGIRNNADGRNYVNFFLTNSTGKITTTGAQSSTTGDAGTKSDNYFDWTRLGRFAAATSNANIIHQSYSNSLASPNTMCVPLQSLRNNKIALFSGAYEARCSAFSISEAEEVFTGNVGSGDNDLEGGEFIDVNRPRTFHSPRNGWITDRLESAVDTEWNSSANRNYQEIFERITSTWAQYSHNVQPTADGDTLTIPAGHLSFSASVDSITNTATNISGISGSKVADSGDLITKINVTSGNVRFPSDATIRQDITVSSTNLIDWDNVSNTPTIIVDGANINGTIEIHGNDTNNYEIRNCDVSNLTVNRKAGSTATVTLDLTNVTGVITTGAGVVENTTYTFTVDAPDGITGRYLVWNKTDSTATVGTGNNPTISTGLAGSDNVRVLWVAQSGSNFYYAGHAGGSAQTTLGSGATVESSSFQVTRVDVPSAIPAAITINADLSVTGSGNTAVLLISLRNSGALTDTQISRFIADQINRNTTNQDAFLRVIAERLLNIDAIYRSGGASNVGNLDSRYVDFGWVSGNNQSYNFGFVTDLDPGATATAFSASRPVTIAASDGGGTLTLNIAFAGTPSNFDLGAADTTISQSVSTMLTAQNATINTSLDDRKLTTSDIEKISRLIPV